MSVKERGNGNGLFLEGMINSGGSSSRSSSQVELPSPIQLAKIPSTCWINGNTLFKCTQDDKILSQALENLANTIQMNERLSIVLFLFLAKCYNLPSFQQWTPYLDILPRHNSPEDSDFDNPILWNEQDLEWLGGTPLSEAVSAKERMLMNEIEVVYSLVVGPLEEHLKTTGQLLPEEEETKFNAQLYIWADLIFWSRVLSFRSTEHVDEVEFDLISRTFPVTDLHLLPLLDFANHSNTPNIRWEINSNDDSLNIITYSNFKDFKISSSLHCEFTELCLSYGVKSNSELLFAYGFYLDDNECNDSYSFPLFIDKADPLKLDKIKFIKSSGSSPMIEIMKKRILEYEDTRNVTTVLERNDLLTLLVSIVECKEELVKITEVRKIKTDLTELIEKYKSQILDRIISACRQRLAILDDFKLSHPNTHRAQLAFKYRKDLKNFLSFTETILQA